MRSRDGAIFHAARMEGPPVMNGPIYSNRYLPSEDDRAEQQPLIPHSQPSNHTNLVPVDQSRSRLQKKVSKMVKRAERLWESAIDKCERRFRKHRRVGEDTGNACKTGGNMNESLPPVVSPIQACGMILPTTITDQQQLHRCIKDPSTEPHSLVVNSVQISRLVPPHSWTGAGCSCMCEDCSCAACCCADCSQFGICNCDETCRCPGQECSCGGCCEHCDCLAPGIQIGTEVSKVTRRWSDGMSPFRGHPKRGTVELHFKESSKHLNLNPRDPESDRQSECKSTETPKCLERPIGSCCSTGPISILPIEQNNDMRDSDALADKGSVEFSSPGRPNFSWLSRRRDRTSRLNKSTPPSLFDLPTTTINDSETMLGNQILSQRELSQIQRLIEKLEEATNHLRELAYTLHNSPPVSTPRLSESNDSAVHMYSDGIHCRQNERIAAPSPNTQSETSCRRVTPVRVGSWFDGTCQTWTD